MMTKIIDGIAYADDLAPAVTVSAVEALDQRHLWLRFSDGQERVFDVTPLLDWPILAPLRRAEVFQAVVLDTNFGVPTWADGTIEIAPETLLARSWAVGQTKQYATV